MREIDKIYCINLDRRQDRWELAQKEFDKACLAVERISAFDTPETPARGNHLSHATALRLAKAAGARNCLIFEDDIEWLQNPLVYLSRTLLEIPEDFDLFYLGVNTERECFQVSSHVARLTFAYSTHAYIVNSSLFDELIELNESDVVHNDVEYSNRIVSRENSYCSIPLLAGQRDSYSDIQGTRMSSNSVFLERFDRHLIRNRATLKPDFVTFITPTLGRPSLDATVQSLRNQVDWNWESIIIGDGLLPEGHKDEHFLYLSTAKKGHAGLVRNEAFPYVDTVWTAFVDDDDTLLSTYVSRLKTHSNDNDIVVFTYKDLSNGNVQPPPKWPNKIETGHVGVSFAVRTEFIRKHNILFKTGALEDAEFLHECVRKGAKFLVTNDIQYLVSKRGGWS